MMQTLATTTDLPEQVLLPWLVLALMKLWIVTTWNPSWANQCIDHLFLDLR
jgi:hypothetical protein